MSNAPEPTGPNPFNVGDLVEVVIAGWKDHRVGDRFVVTGIKGVHIEWAPGLGGGVFTRYRLVMSAEEAAGASMATDEYEAALEAQEAYQALQVPN